MHLLFFLSYDYMKQFYHILLYLIGPITQFTIFFKHTSNIQISFFKLRKYLAWLETKRATVEDCRNGGIFSERLELVFILTISEKLH